MHFIHTVSVIIVYNTCMYMLPLIFIQLFNIALSVVYKHMCLAQNIIMNTDIKEKCHNPSSNMVCTDILNIYSDIFLVMLRTFQFTEN